jgi:hypothetical protein
LDITKNYPIATQPGIPEALKRAAHAHWNAGHADQAEQQWNAMR